MSRIPKRLKKEPLIEAIWQVQFESPGAGDVLPGLLYAALRKDHPKLQLHRLPAADFPAIVAQMDPNLRLAAKVRLEEPEGSFLWQVGDRVATLNCRKPYAGWAAFREAIISLTKVVEESGLVEQPLRHSLRYIDLLALDDAPDLSALQLSMKLGGHAVNKLPVQIRLELPDGGVNHIIQIATPAQVQLPEGQQTGSVVDLETFPGARAANWEGVRNQLDTLHQKSKRLFFEHLLTAEAIEKMEPEY